MVRVLEGGRIVIPASFRKELGLKTGDSLIVELTDGVVRIETRRRAIQRSLDAVAPFRTAPSPVDELLSERRAEAHG